MREPIIYKITNLKNGKVYIGQTIQGIASRKAEHVHRFSIRERDHKLYLAMNKHGIENFKFDTLCCALKEEYLDDMEKYFIEKYNSFNRGYNMTCGGDSVSLETREKLRKVMLGRKITWYNKIVESRKRNPNRKDPKLFVAKGDKNVNAKVYLIVYPDGHEEFIKGLRQFCLENGLSHNLMIAVLNGTQNHHKGYKVKARLNDYPDKREYTQASGSTSYPASLTG